MEYYLAIKWKGIQIHAPTQINLEDIMPREMGQTQKDKHHMISLYEVPRIGKFLET